MIMNSNNNRIIEGFLYLIFLALVFGLVLYKIVFISNISFEASFFTIYGIITTLFLLSRLPYAYLYNDDHKKIYSDSEYPSVTIIIAAKNERGGIFKTLTTCMNSKYSGKLECIVIDDGSTDNTKSEVERAQHLYNKETEKIKLIIFPENRGKKEAMAVGISEALHDIIVFVDSDTFLSPDAIYHITRHFIDNKKIGAVSGNTKVENSNTNLLTKMQSIQYSISFNIYKASESMHNCVTCCPGCFSAYRKKAIKPLANRWKEQKFLGKRGTFGDDRSLTNFVLRKWDVVFCQKAIATTIVPEKFSIYWKQQLRWKNLGLEKVFLLECLCGKRKIR